MRDSELLPDALLVSHLRLFGGVAGGVASRFALVPGLGGEGVRPGRPVVNLN
jgi:hypothetical protein